MIRNLVILSIFVALSCCVTKANPDKTDEYIKTQMAKRHIPGVAVAVIKDRKVLFTGEYGTANIEFSIPVTSETVFEIASLTKTFTATAIVILAEDGKLSLDDKIKKHLSNLPKNFDAITIRQLLNHTSGLAKDLPGYWQSQELKRSDFSKDEFLDLISKLPLNSKPGERAAYSNIGYFLLGLIIEKASGKSYEKFLTEHIFKPLRMNSTEVATRRDVIKNRASGYRWNGENYQNAEYVGLEQHFANGGLVSSVSDLAKWETALNSEKLLKKTNLEKMWKPTDLNDGKPAIIGGNLASKNVLNIGLSWFLGKYRGRKTVFHIGDLPGFSTQMIRFIDDKSAIIILCNSDYGEDGRHNAELLAKSIADIHNF